MNTHIKLLKVVASFHILLFLFIYAPNLVFAGVPTCSVSGPSPVRLRTNTTYSATASSAGGVINGLGIAWSPTASQSWTTIANTPTSSASGVANFPNLATYYVVCNARDTAGVQCTGNPFTVPAGWTDCGAAATRTVQTKLPPPIIDLQSCVRNSDSTYTFSVHAGSGYAPSSVGWPSLGRFMLRYSISPMGVSGHAQEDYFSGGATITYTGSEAAMGGKTITFQAASETSPNVNVGDFGSVSIACPAPPPSNCRISAGPASIIVGQSATYTAVYSTWRPDGVNNVTAGMYAGQAGVMKWAPPYIFGPGLANVTRSFTWTPTVAGSYDVMCYADNATFNGSCIGNFAYRAAITPNAQWLCAGPNARMTVSVVTPSPRPSSTPTPRPATGTATRTPTPRPVTGTSTRTPTATRTGTPAPTNCVIAGSVNLSPSSSTVAAGNTRQFEAVISGLNACGNTVQVNFSSNNTAVANVSPTSDTTARYQTTATVGTSAAPNATATIRADVVIGGVTRFSDTSVITVGGQSCDFDLTPASASIGTGSTQVLQVSNITQSGTIDEVQFSSSDPTIVSVNPPDDSSPTYRTTGTGNAIGTATITADMIMGGSSVCSNSAEITVTGSNPWWQVIESDVITNGDIVSEIPSSCTAAVSCTNSIITEGSGSHSGIASGSSINSGTGTVSESNNWQAASSYNGPTYDYGYFESRSSCGVFSETGSSTIDSLSDLTSGPQSDGYYWQRSTGSSTVTIANNINLGNNKVILFVEGDLRIEGTITFNNGTGFFMAVVSGDIIIDPSVGGNADGTPELEGIYYTDKQFRTGTNGIGADEQLHIRGSVAAFDKIVLERSTPNDATAPAELFEYAPETLLRFPSCIGERSVEWRELAP